MNFNDLTEELSLELNLELHPTDKEAIAMNFEGITLQVEPDEKTENLWIGSLISALPPGKYREVVLKEALKANDRLFPLSFSFLQEKSSLVLFSIVYQPITLKKAVDRLALLLAEAVKWKKAIDANEPAPRE